MHAEPWMDTYRKTWLDGKKTRRRGKEEVGEGGYGRDNDSWGACVWWEEAEKLNSYWLRWTRVG